MSKLVSYCNITKTIVGDTTVLGLKLKPWLVTTVLKNFKVVVTNHGFNFKLKTVLGNYSFNFLKKFKTVVTNYGFDDVARRD